MIMIMMGKSIRHKWVIKTGFTVEKHPPKAADRITNTEDSDQTASF